MYERLSRFDTQPGDIKIPSALLYPDKPVLQLTKWTVRLAADEGGQWERQWAWDTHVWAFSSSDAVGRARSQFYSEWASYEDRLAFPIRVVAVLQEAV